MVKVCVFVCVLSPPTCSCKRWPCFPCRQQIFVSFPHSSKMNKRIKRTERAECRQTRCFFKRSVLANFGGSASVCLYMKCSTLFRTTFAWYFQKHVKFLFFRYLAWAGNGNWVPLPPSLHLQFPTACCPLAKRSPYSVDVSSCVNFGNKSTVYMILKLPKKIVAEK